MLTKNVLQPTSYVRYTQRGFPHRNHDHTAETNNVTSRVKIKKPTTDKKMTQDNRHINHSAKKETDIIMMNKTVVKEMNIQKQITPPIPDRSQERNRCIYQTFLLSPPFVRRIVVIKETKSPVHLIIAHSKQKLDAKTAFTNHDLTPPSFTS